MSNSYRSSPLSFNNGITSSTNIRSQQHHHQRLPNSSVSSTRSNISHGDYLFFDANTFKQVKRLYSGMLMVALAYSITMIIMMVVLYKTLPHSITTVLDPTSSGSSSLIDIGGSSNFGSPFVVPSNVDSTNSVSNKTIIIQPKYQQKLPLSSMNNNNPSFTNNNDQTLNIFTIQKLHQQNHPNQEIMIGGGNSVIKTSDNNHAITSNNNVGTLSIRGHDGRVVTYETARTYLDQVIAINFLTLILYSLAFYASHRELYTLTLAFTSTLSFTMCKFIYIYIFL